MVALIDGLSKGDNELLKYKVAIHTLAALAIALAKLATGHFGRLGGHSGHWPSWPGVWPKVGG